MTKILSDEDRALLKRMDADDAINKAVEMALEAAAKVCRRNARGDGDKSYDSGCRDCATLVLDLKEPK